MICILINTMTINEGRGRIPRVSFCPPINQVLLTLISPSSLPVTSNLPPAGSMEYKGALHHNSGYNAEIRGTHKVVHILVSLEGVYDGSSLCASTIQCSSFAGSRKYSYRDSARDMVVA